MTPDIARSVFFIGLGIIFYVYAFYPPLIFVLSRLFGRLPTPPSTPAPEDWPRVSLLLAAYNEEDALAETLKNALAMDYPADRFEIVVGSDGSDDGTADVARRFADRGVRLLDYPNRRGKSVVLNRSIPTLTGDVILLSDANTLLAPDSAKNLARWFLDPDISCACGRLVLTDSATGKNADGLYWRYETFLKKCEARLGALLGANGAIYAIRRERFEPIPTGTIIDDFVIPLLSVLRHGGRIVFERDAVAREETAPDLAAEFRRRARIGAGGYQSLSLLYPLLDPRRGWLSFAFLSHKVLRWLGPFFLIGMLVSNLAMVESPVWRWVFLGQFAFYAISFLVPSGPSRWLRPLRLMAMFTSMNVGLLVGFWGWMSGRRSGTWTPTARSTPVVESTR